jgi:hypothetical protein
MESRNEHCVYNPAEAGGAGLDHREMTNRRVSPEASAERRGSNLRDDALHSCQEIGMQKRLTHDFFMIKILCRWPPVDRFIS